MNWQRFISSVCIFTLVLTMLCGCSGKTVLKKNSFDDKTESASVSDTVIAENENFKLELNETTMGITLTNLKTGAVYGTNPIASGEQQFDEFGMPIKRHPQVESVLIIDYLDVEKNITSQLISYNAAVKGGRTVAEEIENGIKIKYYFDDAQIMVPVEYSLREDSVAITVNPKEIEENENMLISVAVAPFFCSVENSATDGYLVYPSGSGALVYAKEISQPGEAYEAEVYGIDYSKEVWDKITTEKAIRLPLFGVKTATTAVAGIIEQGAESSLLKMTVGSTSIGYSSVYTTYQLRGYTANIKELYNNRYYEGSVYADNMIETPLTIGFYPLENEKANYSAMAETYRNYLDKTMGEAKAAASSKLDLTFIGGTMTVKSFLGIPYKTLFPTTTISQVGDILNELKEKGLDVSNVTLKGFTENGIDSNKLAGNFKIDSKLGKAKELGQVMELCKNNGTDFYFDFNTVSFNQSANGYKSYFDAAIRANRKPAKDYRFDIAVLGRETENALSLLARDRFTDVGEDVLNAAEKLELSGVGLTSLSNMVYSDYSNKESVEYYAKEGFANQVIGIIDSIKAENKKIITEDANAFAAAKSDAVIGAPTVSSKAFIFDEDIPLYQMVFRGRTSLSAESVNLVAEPDLQLLRAVESGCGLSYTLIADYDTVLLDSVSPIFYNSLYSDIKDTVIENYKSLSDYYEKIADSEIVNHTILESGIRKTEFSNGVTVYVNYSDNEISDAAGKIPAKSFLIEGAK